MKKKPLNISLIFLLFIFLFSSGCLDFMSDFANSGTTTFEAFPTSIQYDITYGYNITSSGTGEGQIIYQEDIPSVLVGSVLLLSTLINQSATSKVIANNSIIEWNLSILDEQHLSLGLSATLLSTHSMITDLSATDALNISQIQTDQPQLITQYCQPQGNNTKWFIEPHLPDIIETAQTLRSQIDSDNSLLIAKHLFSWLKQTTSYTTHPYQKQSQPASLTLQKKTGDCDDLSFLYMSLCRTLNIPSRFVKGFLIDTVDGTPTAIHHLWVEIYVGEDIGTNGWIPVECAGTGPVSSEIYQHFGVEDAAHLRLFIDDGSNQSIIQSNNHIRVTYPETMTISINQFTIITNHSTLESEKLCISQSQRYLC
jgi:hypothetical protein